MSAHPGRSWATSWLDVLVHCSIYECPNASTTMTSWEKTILVMVHRFSLSSTFALSPDCSSSCCSPNLVYPPALLLIADLPDAVIDWSTCCLQPGTLIFVICLCLLTTTV